MGRHFNTEITIDTSDYLQTQTVNRDFKEFLQQKENKLLKQDAHISKRIVREHYKVFKGNLKEFAGLNSTYSAYTAQRLASHPTIPPGNVFNQLVSFTGAIGSLKERCHDMTKLSAMEQQAQSISVKKFYTCLELVEEFKEVGELPRGVKTLQKDFTDILQEASQLWNAQHRACGKRKRNES